MIGVCVGSGAVLFIVEFILRIMQVSGMDQCAIGKMKTCRYIKFGPKIGPIHLSVWNNKIKGDRVPERWPRNAP